VPKENLLGQAGMGFAYLMQELPQERLMLELEQRYFSEYADAWSEAIGQLQLSESDSHSQGVDRLANLTSAQSSLVQLLRHVRENTRLL
ncbi:ImcF-related family protein, partial [Klebsiella pneumoniae]|uniref:ImcF-related family protein n=1 Tax=Klebsiella pneumoniae TaxID=573 RepID=UPI0039C17A9B